MKTKTQADKDWQPEARRLRELCQGSDHTWEFCEDEIEVALRQAQQEGCDEVLKLAAKIVAKLEIAMTPDFSTQIEEALASNHAMCGKELGGSLVGLCVAEDTRKLRSEIDSNPTVKLDILLRTWVPAEKQNELRHAINQAISHRLSELEIANEFLRGNYRAQRKVINDLESQIQQLQSERVKGKR